MIDFVVICIACYLGFMALIYAGLTIFTAKDGVFAMLCCGVVTVGLCWCSAYGFKLAGVL